MYLFVYDLNMNSYINHYIEVLKQIKGTCCTYCSMFAVNVDRKPTRTNLICTRHTHYHLYHFHYTYVYSFKFIQ